MARWIDEWECACPGVTHTESEGFCLVCGEDQPEPTHHRGWTSVDDASPEDGEHVVVWLEPFGLSSSPEIALYTAASGFCFRLSSIDPRRINPKQRGVEEPVEPQGNAETLPDRVGIGSCHA